MDHIDYFFYKVLIFLLVVSIALFSLIFFITLSKGSFQLQDMNAALVKLANKGNTIDTVIEPTEPLLTQAVSKPVEKKVQDNFPEIFVSGEYWFVEDFDNETLLASKDDDIRMYPASMTKIMTVLVALESGISLEQPVFIEPDIFPDLYAQDSMLAGLQPNERVLFRDLLYGAMLPSAGECCLQICREVSGSQEAFVELMNKKAEALGMTGTHYVNSVGLHDQNHYSTGADMRKLFHAAYENEIFRQIILAPSYRMFPSGDHPEGLVVDSTVFAKFDGVPLGDFKILGGKSGFTDEAEQCLILLVERGDRKYLMMSAHAWPMKQGAFKKLKETLRQNSNNNDSKYRLEILKNPALPENNKDLSDLYTSGNPDDLAWPEYKAASRDFILFMNYLIAK